MEITKSNILNYLKLFYDIIDDGWAKDKLTLFFKKCKEDTTFAKTLLDEVYKEPKSIEKAEIVHFIMFPENYMIS